MAAALAVAGEDAQIVRHKVVRPQREAEIIELVIDGPRIAERQDRGLRFGRADRAVTVKIEAADPGAKAAVRSSDRPAGIAVIVSDRGIDRQAVQLQRERGEGRIGAVIDIIVPAAAIAEEAGAVTHRAILCDEVAARIADVDQHGLPVALHRLHVAGPQPVGIDRLARQVEAAGEVGRAATNVERLVDAEIIGDVVEAVQTDVEHHDTGEEPIAADGRSIGGLSGVRPAGENDAGTRAADAIGDVLRRVRARREGRLEAARIVGKAETVGQRPAAAHVDLALDPEGEALHRQAIAEIVARRVVVAVERLGRRQERAVKRCGARVEAGNRLIIGVAAAARHPHWLRQDGGGAVVEILRVEADVPAVELLGDVGLDLAAVIAVVADIARAFPGAVEAADVEVEIVRQRRAVIEIEPVAFEIEADRALDRAAFLFAGLGDEVDHCARRVRREGRGRTAAHCFDTGDRAVSAQEVVGVAEDDVAEFEDRQAVFLKLDIARAAGRDRNPAHRDVGVAFAAGSFRADARDLADQVSRRRRSKVGDRLRTDGADRDRAFDPVLPAGHSRDDDFLTLGFGRGIGGGNILCQSRAHQQARHGCTGAKRGTQFHGFLSSRVRASLATTMQT